MRTVAIVGGSLAGLNAARALRTQEFDGRIVVIGAEEHLPYDRPPLSKEFLAGRVGLTEIALSTASDADLDVEWCLGTSAARLDRGGSRVVLASGQELPVDGVVIATGARARALPGSPLAGVHTLRTAEDAMALRAELVPGARLVVIGAGFIGAEVASTARELGASVTVVEMAEVPLTHALGAHLGAVCAGLHDDNGVRLITGAQVEGLTGDDRVREVRLADGRALPADVVVVGIGAVPNVEWLEGSGIEVDHRGVHTDAAGATNVPEVVAAGDCTCTHGVRQEHWTNAALQPAAAVSTLLGRTAPAQRPPYFWSDQYGSRLQFAGRCRPGDPVEIIEGDVDARRFVAGYRRDGALVAVFAMDEPRLFGKWRRQLA